MIFFVALHPSPALRHGMIFLRKRVFDFFLLCNSPREYHNLIIFFVTYQQDFFRLLKKKIKKSTTLKNNKLFCKDLEDLERKFSWKSTLSLPSFKYDHHPYRRNVLTTILHSSQRCLRVLTNTISTETSRYELGFHITFLRPVLLN